MMAILKLILDVLADKFSVTLVTIVTVSNHDGTSKKVESTYSPRGFESQRTRYLHRHLLQSYHSRLISSRLLMFP